MGVERVHYLRQLRPQYPFEIAKVPAIVVSETISLEALPSPILVEAELRCQPPSVIRSHSN
jgi:hypothetical protein